MGQATPWQLARGSPAQITVKTPRTVVYRRDPYWFAWRSVSHGPDQLPVMIPATGPGAAGSTFPTNQPQIEAVVIEETPQPVTYGSNLGRPAGPAANLPGGI